MCAVSSVNAREPIVAAALCLFAERGFEATGIRDIARRTGITTASLYHHFDSKQDMLEEIIGEGMRLLVAGASDAAEGATHPEMAIEALVTHHVNYNGTNRLLSSVIDTEFRSLTDDRLTRIVRLRDNYDAIWDAAIKQGVSESVFDVEDEKLTRLAIIGMCKDVPQWYSPAGRLTLERIAKLYVSIALRALGRFRE